MIPENKPMDGEETANQLLLDCSTVKLQPKFAKARDVTALTVFCLLLVALFSRLEYAWAEQGDLEPCYLIPIVLLAWYGGRAASSVGIISSLLAGYVARYLASQLPIFSGFVVWKGLMRLALFVSVALLVAAFRETWEREKKLGRTDDLTHVSNRRAFLELADVELQRARRYAHPFTLAYLDLDDFKGINDRFGHHVGDQVLALTAETLRGAVRSTDILARLGGDEFAILLPETPEPAARQVLQKLRSRMIVTMAEHSWPVSCSIGAATFVHPGVTIEEMLKVADGLLYSVKRNGKNRIVYEVRKEESLLTHASSGVG